MTNTTKPIKTLKRSKSSSTSRKIKIITDIKTVDDCYNIVRGEKE